MVASAVVAVAVLFVVVLLTVVIVSVVIIIALVEVVKVLYESRNGCGSISSSCSDNSSRKDSTDSGSSRMTIVKVVIVE